LISVSESEGTIRREIIPQHRDWRVDLHRNYSDPKISFLSSIGPTARLALALDSDPIIFSVYPALTAVVAILPPF
jgi:hypothetical protein